jgi:exosortase/archaeosortase family protein
MEARPSREALRFGVAATLLSLASFAALRLAFVERCLLQPMTSGQERLAAAWMGAPVSPIAVTLSCSGADLVALCVAMTLAYPVAWTRRLAGAAVGIAGILLLNTIRIGSLGRVAGTPLFMPLHVYVWPAALVVATLGYVGLWMWHGSPPAGGVGPEGASRHRTRFVLIVAATVAAYLVAAAWLQQQAFARTWAYAIAEGSRLALGALGVPASSDGGGLVTPRGAFVVTPECVLTPLMPLYLAVLFAWPLSWPRRLAGLAAFPFLFGALSILRLLTLALPPIVMKSPIFLAHGFHQLVLAAVAIAAACAWSAGWTLDRPWMARTLRGWGLALVLAVAFGRAYTALVTGVTALLAHVWPHALVSLTTPQEVQGAWAILPAYQVVLLATLWICRFGRRGPGRLALGLVVLFASQVALLVAAGELKAHLHLVLPVLAVRGWALAAPLAVLALIAFRTSGDEPTGGDGAYRRFWTDVGDRFPDLDGAVSTAYYRANEQRLFTELFPSLQGLSILKTDLWDEAKNTRILRWAADQGALAFGVDISEPTLRQALAAFPAGGLRAAASDIRRLPLRDGSIDAIYSMGTIEHFLDPEVAVAEMYRVLKPGGTAIIGVPNRWDPFLRPLLVSVMWRLGLYAYGYEKSFSMRGLRRMLETAGFQTTAESGILFMPGWLRMLELGCRQLSPALGRAVGLAVWPFVLADRWIPAVRRHGYLIAVAVVKPR